MKNEDINIIEKIETFKLLVGNNNEDIAYNYLERAKWDETKAAMLFNQENTGKNAKINIPIEDDFYKYNNFNNFNNNNFPPFIDINANQFIINNFQQPRINTPIINNNNNNNQVVPKKKYKINKIIPRVEEKIKKNPFEIKLDKYKECKIYKRGFSDKFKFFKTDNRPYFVNFQNKFKNCIQHYDAFISSIKSYVGMIMLYDITKLNEAVNIIENLSKKEGVRVAFNLDTALFPLIKNSIEGGQITSDLKITRFPCILICLYKNENNFAVIGQINDIMKNTNLLTEKLREGLDLLLDKKELIRNKKIKDDNKIIIPVKKKN